MAKTTEPEYIVDRRGRKTKIILPVKEYETMPGDLYDLRRAAEVRGQQSIPWEAVRTELKRDGLL